MKRTMQDYIQESAETCRRLLEDDALCAPVVDLCRQKKPETIWLVASGSSYNACVCAQPYMERWMDSKVELMTPFTVLYYTPAIREDDLVLVITQSGLSTNAIAVLDSLQDRDNVICLTGNRESDVKDHTACVLEYGVGEELVGYVTKGVSTLCLYLMRVAQILADRPLEEFYTALETFRHTVTTTEGFVKRHFRALSSMQTVYCLGAKNSAGVAMEAALKIGETVHVPAFFYEAEEFIHGPNLQLTPNYTMFFFDSNDRASHRIQAIWESACLISDRAYLITMDPDRKDQNNVLFMDPAVSPLFTSFAALPFAQLVSAEISGVLHSTMQHPLLKQFKEHTSAKTENFVNYDGDEA
ncbi:SIS domain-containing protein [Faecalibaculum rodentium]|uniref:SIS domain-containing protein n=1 Tax=Faecalibaculum rodentium TaxID=1702221 RepID=UPI002619AA67|nr:SIS domain-containing protein [Faecalibaculum rodentium]